MPIDVAVVGAGIAGACLATSLVRRGASVTLIERGDGPASGASGNPAVVVKPAVAREASPITELLDASWHTLQAWLSEHELADGAGFRRIGVLQRIEKTWSERTVPHGERWPILDADAASDRAGIRLDGPAIDFGTGGFLSLGKLTRRLASHRNITVLPLTTVTGVSRMADGRWRLALGSSDRGSSDRGSTVHRSWLDCRHVVFATASANIPGSGLDALPLIPVRGQTTRWKPPINAPAFRSVLSGKHYAFRDGDTWVSGSTYRRHERSTAIQDTDHEHNRDGLGALLGLDAGTKADWIPVDGFAGVRATTPDRLPIAGPIPDVDACRERYAELHHGRSRIDWETVPAQPGRWACTGLGSRGVLFAPWLAEYLAARICGTDEDYQSFTPLVHPVRFLLRALRRGAV